MYFSTYSGMREMFGSSVLQGVLTGFLAIYGDLGIVGAVLFLGFHLYAFRRILRQYNQGLYKDPPQGVLAEAFLPAVVLYGILIFLTDLFSQPLIQNGLWICAAVLWKPEPAGSVPDAGEAPKSGDAGRTGSPEARPPAEASPTV
jgi:hypothetical protein